VIALKGARTRKIETIEYGWCTWVWVGKLARSREKNLALRSETPKKGKSNGTQCPKGSLSVKRGGMKKEKKKTEYQGTGRVVSS